MVMGVRESEKGGSRLVVIVAKLGFEDESWWLGWGRGQKSVGNGVLGWRNNMHKGWVLGNSLGCSVIELRVVWVMGYGWKGLAGRQSSFPEDVLVRIG